MRLTRKIKIKNNLGLHIRPATSIAKILQATKSDVFITYKNQTINAKSIMSVLMLGVKKNAEIVIIIDGTDAKDLMKILIKAFKNSFGEE